MAQRFSSCLRPRVWSWSPGIKSHIGLPAWSLLLPLPCHPPSTSTATSSQCRQLLRDSGPPPLGYTRGTGHSQVPQSKHAERLPIPEELGKEIRPTTRGARARGDATARHPAAGGPAPGCWSQTERKAGS
ncbi:unnamed protein product [Nyctereutes procyonoides]|uniref:(raccoon dog) hypothetical protein n=1 Tax=Nyctereutes procyonoides TaxID=34880 RepID=A0A811ZH85_NYCPR|nr:unnamed protein product [Nyctereutes procyonoides]